MTQVLILTNDAIGDFGRSTWLLFEKSDPELVEWKKYARIVKDARRERDIPKSAINYADWREAKNNQKRQEDEKLAVQAELINKAKNTDFVKEHVLKAQASKDVVKALEKELEESIDNPKLTGEVVVLQEKIARAKRNVKYHDSLVEQALEAAVNKEEVVDKDKIAPSAIISTASLSKTETVTVKVKEVVESKAQKKARKAAEKAKLLKEKADAEEVKALQEKAEVDAEAEEARKVTEKAEKAKLSRPEPEEPETV